VESKIKPISGTTGSNPGLAEPMKIENWCCNVGNCFIILRRKK
jgi:hypothetical protein